MVDDRFAAAWWGDRGVTRWRAHRSRQMFPAGRAIFNESRQVSRRLTVHYCPRFQHEPAAHQSFPW